MVISPKFPIGVATMYKVPIDSILIIKFWIHRSFVFMGILAFMCSCAPSSPLTTITDDISMDRKSTLGEQENRTSALDLHELAEAADETIKNRLFLESALLYKNEGNYFLCSEVLKKINGALLSDANYLIYGLLKAEILNHLLILVQYYNGVKIRRH